VTNQVRYLLLIASLLAPLATAAAAASAPPVLVCYPGGPVNAADAKGAMDAMLRVVERVGQWPARSLTSLFTSNLDQCKRLLAEKRPSFAILSLGQYLEQRVAHNLVPLVQPRMKGRTSERYRVLTQKGKFTSLEDLKGKSLGGTVLQEAEFIGKIVLAGRYDPTTFFLLKPSTQAIRALRALDKGELDAVMLNEQQFSGLASLALQNPMEAVFTSEELPLMGMAADSKTSTAEDRARYAKALEAMCTDPEGKKLCDLFGVESFAAVNPVVFEPVVKLWAGGH
jgi:ABC-type amino acid transport substrate-binding protein